MGICSRKQADVMIQAGRVTVNQNLATLGLILKPEDQVRVDGKSITSRPEKIFLLYHKPVGVVCTHDSSVKNSLENRVDYPQRVFAVGRLDKDSEGLLLLTNQGEAVNKICARKMPIKKSIGFGSINALTASDYKKWLLELKC